VEVLKWIGYIVAAIAVLSVALGLGAIIGVVVLFGAALVFSVGLILLVAGFLRGR
jgi:hypothetical protein